MAAEIPGFDTFEFFSFKDIVNQLLTNSPKTSQALKDKITREIEIIRA